MAWCSSRSAPPTSPAASRWRCGERRPPERPGGFAPFQSPRTPGPEINRPARNLPALRASKVRKFLKFKTMEIGIEFAIPMSPGGISHGDRGSGSLQQSDAGQRSDAEQRPSARLDAGCGSAVDGGPLHAADLAVAQREPDHVGRRGSPACPSDGLSRWQERAL